MFSVVQACRKFITFLSECAGEKKRSVFLLYRPAAGSGGCKSPARPGDGHCGELNQHQSERSESGPAGSGTESLGAGGSAKQEAAQGGLLLPQLQRRRGQVRATLTTWLENMRAFFFSPVDLKLVK